MDKLFVIKIGGNIIDDDSKLSFFLREFASIAHPKILVHGGGILATQLAEKLQVPQQMVDGRRITDEETLRIVTMVYAGYINKKIVAQLQGAGCNAVGLTGADGNLIRSHKRIAAQDFGFVGDVDVVNAEWIKELVTSGATLVVAPVTHNGKGQLLNTNADTIAQELAKSLQDFFSVELVYSFEKEGVLADVADEQSVIRCLSKNDYVQLKETKTVHSGMIPKLDNAFAAIDSGVKAVTIGKAEKIIALINGLSGTRITNE